MISLTTVSYLRVDYKRLVASITFSNLLIKLSGKELRILTSIRNKQPLLKSIVKSIIINVSTLGQHHFNF